MMPGSAVDFTYFFAPLSLMRRPPCCIAPALVLMLTPIRSERCIHEQPFTERRPRRAVAKPTCRRTRQNEIVGSSSPSNGRSWRTRPSTILPASASIDVVGWCPDPEVRIILRHIRLQASESKDISNLLSPQLLSQCGFGSEVRISNSRQMMRTSEPPHQQFCDSSVDLDLRFLELPSPVARGGKDRSADHG
jgi:hypothetical protein